MELAGLPALRESRELVLYLEYADAAHSRLARLSRDGCSRNHIKSSPPIE
jgi:hypothetical protein